MKRDIRRKDSSFFTPFLIAKMSLSAVLKTIAILLIYFINLKLYNIEVATTMSFLTLVLLEMIYAYSCKNLKTSILNKNIFNNGYMNKSMLVLGIIQIIIFTTHLKSVFGIVGLNLLQFVYCFLIVLFIFLIDELSKKIIAKLFRD